MTHPLSLKSALAWVSGFVAFAFFASLAIWLYASQWHPSIKQFPEQGIDVSHHQGPIKWQALSGQGVSFVYIKATEGGDFKDRLFAKNWSSSKEAGIKRGAYHFFTLCRSGLEQAANFVESVQIDPEALPPAVDLEFMGNCSNKMSREMLHSELADFLGIVETRYQKKAVLYLTQEFDEAFGISQRFDRPLWLRSIVREPRFGARPWQIWQASNFRRLDGVDGRVDWNVRR